MKLTAKAWNSPAADSKPLSELMKSFGCVDVIAPVDAVTFSRRAGELISRKKAPTARQQQENIACEPYSALKLQPKRGTPMPKIC
jgi:hypothetical protein